MASNKSDVSLWKKTTGWITLQIGCVIISACQASGTQWGWQISMPLMSLGNPLCSQPVGVSGSGPVNHGSKKGSQKEKQWISSQNKIKPIARLTTIWLTN